MAALGAALAGAAIVHGARAGPATPAERQAAAPRGADAAPAHAAAERALLDRYCVSCHNDQLVTAGLSLQQADITRVADRADVWEKVLRKVRTGAMPPAGRPRPDKAEYEALASYLDTELDQAAAARPRPGRPTIHRLNRAEYANAVRDLLGVEIDVRSLLPADGAGYGFDNIADVLSVSPGLLERYLSAARRISRLAVGDPTIRPGVETYTIPKYLRQDARMGEELPFGSRGGMAFRHYFPLDGEYVIKVRLQRTWRDEIRGLGTSHQLEIRIDRARVQEFTIGGTGPRATWSPGQAVPTPTEYEMTADKGIEARVSAKAGSRLVAVDFVNDHAEPEGILRPNLPVTSFEFAGNREVDPGVDLVQIAGPYEAAGPGEPAARRRIFSCYPASAAEEEPCAKAILSALGRRGYRRPVTAGDLQLLLGLYRAGRATGSFDLGIERALEGILVDPDFLFRLEHEPSGVAPDTAYPISDLELASRLSFFLWSSIPDEELLGLAARGRLSDPPTLERQVQRMFHDPRATALVTNFAGQWLYTRNMREIAPDPNAFPDFDDTLRDGFERETELFLTSMLSEDRSVFDLLTARYTYLNERLAEHYGIPNVYGSHFRRVAVTDPMRVGLLGQGSILTVTSYATRTSPVTRGRWLLENILGAPLPPPPPNVPSLKDNPEDGRPQSVRERMEEHRKNPVCASCHARMDPLGFALENFDAIGRWRATEEGDVPIDPSGVMPDGSAFEGPVGLRAALAGRGDEFVSTVAEKLLTYALGRGLEHYDGPAVRRIVREAAAGHYRWSSLVLAIARSTPFRMRLSEDASVPTPASSQQGSQP
jgi:hypothetical protein